MFSAFQVAMESPRNPRRRSSSFGLNRPRLQPSPEQAAIVELRRELGAIQSQIQRLALQRELAHHDAEQERATEMEQLREATIAELERVRQSTRDELQSALSVVGEWIDQMEVTVTDEVEHTPSRPRAATWSNMERDMDDDDDGLSADHDHDLVRAAVAMAIHVPLTMADPNGTPPTPVDDLEEDVTKETNSNRTTGMPSNDEDDTTNAPSLVASGIPYLPRGWLSSPEDAVRSREGYVRVTNRMHLAVVEDHFKPKAEVEADRAESTEAAEARTAMAAAAASAASAASTRSRTPPEEVGKVKRLSRQLAVTLSPARVAARLVSPRPVLPSAAVEATMAVTEMALDGDKALHEQASVASVASVASETQALVAQAEAAQAAAVKVATAGATVAAKAAKAAEASAAEVSAALQFELGVARAQAETAQAVAAKTTSRAEAEAARAQAEAAQAKAAVEDAKAQTARAQAEAARAVAALASERKVHAAVAALADERKGHATALEQTSAMRDRSETAAQEHAVALAVAVARAEAARAQQAAVEAAAAAARESALGELKVAWATSVDGTGRWRRPSPAHDLSAASTGSLTKMLLLPMALLRFLVMCAYMCVTSRFVTSRFGSRLSSFLPMERLQERPLLFDVAWMLAQVALPMRWRGTSATPITMVPSRQPGRNIPVDIAVPSESVTAQADERSPLLILWMPGNSGSGVGEGLLCRFLAHRLHATVVSTEYRTVPEHAFPASIEDGEDVARALLADPAYHGHRFLVAGMSAGGYLAIQIAITLAHAGVHVDGHVAICPMVGPFVQYQSEPKSWWHSLLPRHSIPWSWTHFLRDVPPHNWDWRVSALLASDEQLTRTCPGIVVFHSFDPGRDEGAAYAERLAAVGRLHAACEISSRGLGFGMHEILETVAERIESRLAWAPQRRTEG